MGDLVRHLLIMIGLTAVMSLRAGPSLETALSSGLTIGVLRLVLRSMRGRGRPMVWALFCMYAGGSFVSSAVEAAVFKVMRPGEAALTLAGGLVTSFLVAAGLVWAGRRGAAEAAQLMPWRWVPALAAAVVFALLYFIAGSIMYPWFREFYQGRYVPPLPLLLALQVGRGLVWAAIAFPCLRRIQSARRAILVCAVTFAILGAIAPLLLPNEAMPAPIRLAHMIEMTASHLLFGAFTAWVFTRRQPHLAPMETPTRS